MPANSTPRWVTSRYWFSGLAVVATCTWLLAIALTVRSIRYPETVTVADEEFAAIIRLAAVCLTIAAMIARGVREVLRYIEDGRLDSAVSRSFFLERVGDLIEENEAANERLAAEVMLYVRAGVERGDLKGRVPDRPTLVRMMREERKERES